MMEMPRFYPNDKVRVARGKDYLECQGEVLTSFKNELGSWVYMINWEKSSGETPEGPIEEGFLEKAL